MPKITAVTRFQVRAGWTATKDLIHHLRHSGYEDIRIDDTPVLICCCCGEIIGSDDTYYYDHLEEVQKILEAQYVEFGDYVCFDCYHLYGSKLDSSV